jgi:hypothetical protein
MSFQTLLFKRKVEVKTMDKRPRALSLAFTVLLLLLACAPAARAQQAAHRGVAAADPLTMLPASDVVMVIDPARIWNEAIPRFFGNNTGPLDKIMAEMEQMKAKTGVDIRSITRIVVGLRFVNPESVTKNLSKKDMALVIIAQGDFPASKFLDLMRSEAKDKVREVQHGGQTIYTIEEPPKGDAPRSDTERQAVAVLDANTIAIGDLMQMRATIDARSGNNTLSPELRALVTRNSNALISLAGNVPPSLAQSVLPQNKEGAGTGEMDQVLGKFLQAVASIRQMYMAVGMTPGGMDATLGARFSSAEHAQSLGDMLLGARQQYGVFIEDKTVRELVNAMQITAQGDELQLHSEVPQAVITAMLNDARKKESAAAAAAAAKPSATIKTLPPAQQQPKKRRRSTRRRRG